MVKNWFFPQDANRQALPDVEQGSDIGNLHEKNLQLLITNEDPANIYASETIREIVDFLEP